MKAVEMLAVDVGTKPACEAFDLSRATFYRRKPGRVVAEQCTPVRPAPARALSPVEKKEVLDLMHCQRFVDQAPREIYATLLDEGRYLCSVRTMYRILEKEGEVRERRNQLRHPAYRKPELLATAPNQVWSWDITKLLGPAKWTYYYLYVILDIFSRYVVGWMIAGRESASLAERLIEETCHKQVVQPNQLTIHADRGSSMTSKPVAFLLADLGITKTHSRPHTSDDNPFSEAQFKTLKYRPDFPQRFGSIEDARSFCQVFFGWYNQEHHHSGISLLTPHTVHHGHAHQILEARLDVLTRAYQGHPERFVKGAPIPTPLPEAVWINPPPAADRSAKPASDPGVSPLSQHP
jgi:putative transposase